MSAYDTITPANRQVPLGSITTFRVVSVFERAADAFVSWRNARANAKVLRSLSDRQLDDIGLHRGDIGEVAEQLARR
jgi:uncharacterized protein YjiS (DUF1127 family)